MATTELRTPVAVEMNFGGATIGQYDQILEKMGLSAGRRGTQSAIFPLGREDRRRYARGRRLGDTGGVRPCRAREDRPLRQGSRYRTGADDPLLRRPQLPDGSLAEKLSA